MTVVPEKCIRCSILLSGALHKQTKVVAKQTGLKTYQFINNVLAESVGKKELYYPKHNLQNRIHKEFPVRDIRKTIPIRTTIYKKVKRDGKKMGYKMFEYINYLLAKKLDMPVPNLKHTRNYCENIKRNNI